ncbi:ABC transporter permease [Salarchaeum sp. III]|uniref:ABC transporter permease n=1 Tax=Salarchaeum sp. III TaxID=3107927 RepID=UPI002EDA833F
MASLGGDARYVLGRLAWAVAVVWVVLTATYLVLAVLPDTRRVFFAEVEMGLGAVLDADGGPLDQYLAWMHAFLTVDWGCSLYYDTSVVSLYATRLPVTLTYLVPGVLVSLAVGLGVGTYAAVEPGSRLDRALSVVSYVGLAVPAFLLAELAFAYHPTVLGWVRVYDPELGLLHAQNLTRLALPAGIVALSLTAVQIRHVKGVTADRLDDPFVKTARSKGAGRLRVARHVFRNTWPTLVSTVLGEALGLLVLTTIVVEGVLDVPGAAVAVFNGFGAGDPMLSFTAVFGMVALGVLGSLLRDVVRLAVDPRVT